MVYDDECFDDSSDDESDSGDEEGVNLHDVSDNDDDDCSDSDLSAIDIPSGSKVSGKRKYPRSLDESKNECRKTKKRKGSPTSGEEKEMTESGERESVGESEWGGSEC